MIVLRPILGQENSLCTELGQEGAELDASLSALLLSAIFFKTSNFGGFQSSLCVLAAGPGRGKTGLQGVLMVVLHSMIWQGRFLPGKNAPDRSPYCALCMLCSWRRQRRSTQACKELL